MDSRKSGRGGDINSVEVLYFWPNKITSRRSDLDPKLQTSQSYPWFYKVIRSFLCCKYKKLQISRDNLIKYQFGGSDIQTSLDFEWSKRGWVANGLDFVWDLKSGSPTL